MSRYSRYVDIKQLVSATYYDEEHEEWSQKIVSIEDLLCSACDDFVEATNDVKQIVHGSWEVHRFIPENSNSGVTYTRCSICGNLPMLNPYSKEEELTNFCPYCGADMRGE